jgi:hypothetical protein
MEGRQDGPHGRRFPDRYETATEKRESILVFD